MSSVNCHFFCLWSLSPFPFVWRRRLKAPGHLEVSFHVWKLLQFLTTDRESQAITLSWGSLAHWGWSRGSLTHPAISHWESHESRCGLLMTALFTDAPDVFLHSSLQAVFSVQTVYIAVLRYVSLLLKMQVDCSVSGAEFPALSHTCGLIVVLVCTISCTILYTTVLYYIGVWSELGCSLTLQLRMLFFSSLFDVPELFVTLT